MSRFRMIVAPQEGAADGAADFNFTQPGELLYENPLVCCSSLTCGCNRSLAGAESSKATTVGVVAEVDLPPEALVETAERVSQRAGWDEDTVLVSLLRIQAIAGSHPVGTLLRPWFNPDVAPGGAWEYTRFGEEAAS